MNNVKYKLKWLNNFGLYFYGFDLKKKKPRRFLTKSIEKLRLNRTQKQMNT